MIEGQLLIAFERIQHEGDRLEDEILRHDDCTVGQEELPANGTLRRGHGLLHLHDAAAEFLLGDAHLEKIRIVYIPRSRFEQPLDLSLRLVDYVTSPIRQ